MKPNNKTILATLQMIVMVQTVNSSPTTMKMLLAQLASNPIFMESHGSEKKYKQTVAWMVKNGLLGFSQTPTGKPGQPAKEYFVSEKGRLMVTAAGQVPDAPPHTSAQGQNPTCVAMACSKALISSLSNLMELDFHQVYVALMQNVDVDEKIFNGDFFDGDSINLLDISENIMRRVQMSVKRVESIQEDPQSCVAVVRAGPWLYTAEGRVVPDPPYGFHMVQVHRVTKDTLFASNSWGGAVQEIPVPMEEIRSMWKVGSQM